MQQRILRTYNNTFLLSCVLLMTISTAVVVPAAEDHREGPHTLEQQSGHVATQV